MNNTWITGKAITMMIVSLFILGSILVVENSHGEPVYNPYKRAPILIDGNSDFTSENGVTAGSGTAMDPYLIENWDIYASDMHGITIKNTDAYFIISDVTVYGGNYDHGKLHDDYDGISLSNVDNGIIEDSEILSNTYGIRVYDSNNIDISGNDLLLNDIGGISLGECEDILVVNNYLSDNADDYGLEVVNIYDSEDVMIMKNTITNSRGSGIQITTSTTVLIKNNSVTHTGSESMGAVRGYQSSFIDVTQNSITDNDEAGISFAHCDHFGFVENIIHRNGQKHSFGSPGIRVYYCNDGSITGNSVAFNPNDGIRILDSNSIAVVNNHIHHNTDPKPEPRPGPDIITPIEIKDKRYGLRVGSGSVSILVYHNNFWGNYPNAVDNGENNAWDNGYPSGGNYWHDYKGVDERNGPDQNLAGADGIGDSWYYFDGSADPNDRYPLMKNSAHTLYPDLALAPKTINLKNNGETIHAKLGFDKRLDLNDIELDSVALRVIQTGRTDNPAVMLPVSCEVRGKELLLKFDRKEVSQYFDALLFRTADYTFRGTLDLSISGQLRGGETFAGYAHIQVMGPPGEKTRGHRLTQMKNNL